MSDLAYTPAQLAEQLGCSVWTVRKLTDEGRIPHVRLTSRNVVHPRRLIDEWLTDEGRASTLLAEIEADGRGAA